MSVVTQPGVDFGHTSIYPFVPEAAQPLSRAILEEDGLTYEAHSTDYQPTEALTNLVKSHFFFLKVGPELTFRFREAVWALGAVEAQMNLPDPSGIRDVLARRMEEEPGYWKDYYSGDAATLRTLQIYSYSDRIQYYWTDPEVAAALTKLIRNLEQTAAPETLISQSFMGLEFGEMPTAPETLIEHHVRRCIGRYFQAAGASA